MPAINITDLNNANLDADHIAAIATSMAATATDRLGNVKQTINGVVLGLNAQAAITQTSINRVATEAAAGAAQGAANLYADITSGVAGTVEGRYFSIPSSAIGEVAAIYRKVAGAAVDTGLRTASQTGISAIKDEVLPRNAGVPAIAAGSVATDGSVFYYPDSIRTGEQYVDTLSIAVDRVSVANIIVALVSGGNLTVVSSTTRPVSPGVNAFAGLNILVPPNCVVGVSCVGNYFVSANPALMWSTASQTPSNTPYVVQTNTFTLLYNVGLRGLVSGRALGAFKRVGVLEVVVGDVTALGWTNLAAGASNATAGNTYVFGVPTVKDTAVTKARFWLSAAGPITVIVAMRGNTATSFSVLRSVTLQAAAGLNELDVSLVAPAGSFLALYSPTAIIRFTSGTNTEGFTSFQVPGLMATNTEPSTTFTTLRFEMGFTLSSGLYAVAGQVAPDIAGINALRSADNTGVADATALVTGAMGSFDYPYVPAGKFTLTSIAKFARGLYGPGKLTVAGQRYFIGKTASDRSLLKSLRSSLAANIVNNDVLSFVGDSITHYVGASAADKHWLEMLTQYANFGVAADKPTMTALVNSNGTYTPAFYGVTLAGTVSNGGGGPLSESLILAAGASLSFIGTFEQIDCFYRADVGAGTLTFAFNGTAFKTVNAAAAAQVLDTFSGPTATAQTGSGTYSITASGGSVEITGLVRLGILAADGLRLRTSRCAHGGYFFSSFNAAAVASIVKQATYAGGKCVPVIALGTNDSGSLTSDQVVANARVVINLFIAAGITKMFAIPPFRQFNEVGMLKLRKLYADNGIVVVGTDSVDWWNSSLLQDAVHPNDTGNDLLAQMTIDKLAQLA